MATTVWHNGKVWINEHESSDAIAASDGVIVAHGADALAISADEKIDLKGATLLPGFGDGHAHPVFGGIETLFAPVRGPEKLEQLLEAIKTWADENPDAPWVRGEGYDPSLSPRGEFDAKWLDEIVPDRPVVLRAMDYHTAWVNTKALELAGITKDTPQPADGEISLREDGTPSGTLREWGAWKMVYDLLPPLTLDQRAQALRAASTAFSTCGVTWAQDASTNRDRVKNEAPEFLTGNTVKFFADGILEGGTAAVLEDYCDCPNKGMPNWRREELFEAVAAVVARGFQAHIHAIGDAGIRNALDAFEYARKAGGKLINPVIAHSQLIDPADLPRFKDLDVIANFEPLWAQLANEQVVLTIPRLGQERADRQYPMATLLHSGTKISFGSDWPVTSPVPMEGIGVAITRQTNEEFPPGGWVPKERLTLDEALTAYTMGTAVQAGEENLWGDLAIGKRADVVVMATDIHALELMQVRKAKVVGTWLGGVRVFG
jgi:predicted amidohydrolase YtcJ